MRVRRTPFLRVPLARIRRSPLSARTVGLRRAAAALRRPERAERRIGVAEGSRGGMRGLVGARIGSVNDSNRINLDQVAGGQRRYAEHHVGWLMTPEKLFPSLFDNCQAFVAFVVDDIDGDPGDMLRSCPGSNKCTAEIAKHLARLRRKIIRA